MLRVSIIAALAEGSRAIGLRGGLPWRLPADLAHFRRLTMGHTVIMGRVTWEPIAARGLPGRRVIVLTRGDPSRISGVGGEANRSVRSEAASEAGDTRAGDEVQAAESLKAALDLARQFDQHSGRAGGLSEAAPDPDIFIAGGASVYQLALDQDLVDRMYLTLVQAEVEADSYFPPFDPEGWELISEEVRLADEQNPYPMRFQTLDRLRPK